MYQLLIFSVLNSVLVSASVDVNQPVAASYAIRTDDDQKGGDYDRGYSKKYGYNKVVVTTYVVPKIVPAASYSTYIIHPVGVTPCGYSAMDSESAPSFQKVEIKTQDIPMKRYSVEDHTMDRRVIETYAMNAQSVNDDSMEGQVMEGHAMKGYVVEGHAMDGYVIDGFEEGSITEEEPRQAETHEKYQSVAGDNFDELQKGWYKNEDPEQDDYWEKIKKQFDAYYEEQYKKFFNDQHPYLKESWHGFEGSPIVAYDRGYEDGNGDGFADFQQRMAYIRQFENPYEKVGDFKPDTPFTAFDADYEKGLDFKPRMSLRDGYEVFDKGFGDDDALRIKNGYRFNRGDFDFGYGMQEKYEPKWR